MTLFKIQPSHGEEFAANARRIIRVTLRILKKEPAASSLSPDLILNTAFRYLDYWRTRYTYTTSSYEESGLLLEKFAEPVYAALDRAHALISTKHHLSLGTESFVDVVGETLRRAVIASEIEELTNQFEKKIAGYGASSTVTLRWKNGALDAPVVIDFFERCLVELRSLSV